MNAVTNGTVTLLLTVLVMNAQFQEQGLVLVQTMTAVLMVIVQIATVMINVVMVIMKIMFVLGQIVS
jgi:hypothetical protein